MEFLFVLLIVVLIVFIQLKVYEKRTFSRFEYSCRFSEGEASEGDEIKLVETVSNKKPLMIPWLRSEITTSAWLDYAGAQSHVTDETRFVASFFLMRSFSRTTRSWNVRCAKRGVYRIEKCILLSTDLLGLRSFSHPVKTEAELVVLPKPADIAGEFTAANRLSGDVLVRRHYIEDPFYIAGVREYTDRDTINKVHWPATARTGRLMVHNNQYTVDKSLLVILNMQPAPYEGGTNSGRNKAETGIRACAGYFDDSVRSGIPVRFAVNAGISDRDEAVVTNEFSGAEHVLDLMRTLARLPLKADVPFGQFLQERCLELPASDIVIVTPWLDETIYDFARHRTDRGSSVKILCTSGINCADVPDDCAVFGFTGEEGQ